MNTKRTARSGHRQHLLTLQRILPLMLSLFWLPLSASAATYTVTTTNDANSGSLRQAMHDANSNAGPDMIQFDIPGAGTKSIELQSALPPITDPLILDGTTQPGFTNKPVIELNGANAGLNTSGLLITAGNCTVRGLAINRFKDNGIQLQTSGGNVIEWNFIGLDLNGTIDRGNSQRGILITDSASNRIGGTIASAGNVISGNGTAGIRLENGSPGNLVQGNTIGLDILGTHRIPNGNGVTLHGVSNNRIGGTTPAERNVISGNSDNGVLIESGATDNVIEGNYIGLDPTGQMLLRNVNRGVYLSDSATVRNLIGGTKAGAGNVIAGNGASGVRVDDGASGNGILGNSIFANGYLGINLGDDDVTANDPADQDSGPNRLQNYPILLSATNTVDGISVRGSLNTVPNSVGIAVEFFANDACNPFGYGEGQTFLGRITVATDASGNAVFSTILPSPIPSGPFITATATLANNTSEFSPCLALTQFSPVLTIRLAGQGQIALEWSAAVVGFQLESTETLSPPAWLPVAAAIETTNGINRVTTATGNGIRFYQLKK